MLPRCLLAVVLMLAACEGDDGLATVIVELRTNLTPGMEFAAVDVSVRHSGGMGSESTPALGTDDWFGGMRVAELSDVAPGLATIQVAMRDSSGAVVLQRPVEVDVAGDLGVTVVMTRDCLEVSCPGATDAASARACLGGLCVEPACRVGALHLCGAVRCIADIGCGLPAGCVVPRCVGGACVSELEDSMCGAGERCVAGQGCVGPTPTDGGMDSGCAPDCPAPDAGPPCPSAPILPYLGAPCSESTLACLGGCSDGMCQAECFAAADPECFVCVNQSLARCSVEAGCQPEWDCFAECATDQCASIHNCATVGCDSEAASFNDCTNDAFSRGSCQNAYASCFAGM